MKMFPGQIDSRNAQSMFSLIFIICITSMGSILGNPVSVKSSNFDGFVHCIIKLIYIFSVNPQSTVKNIEAFKKSDSLKSPVGNGRVIRNIILLTLLFQKTLLGSLPHGYDLDSTRRTALKCNDELHFSWVSFVVVVYFFLLRYFL